MKYMPDRGTLLQMLFWSGLWILVPLLLSGNWSITEYHFRRSVVIGIGVFWLVYINLMFVLPAVYLKHRKPLLFVAAGMALVLLFMVLAEWDYLPWADWLHKPAPSADMQKPAPPGWNGKKSLRYIALAMPFFTAFIGSSLFAVARFAITKEKEAADYKSEKLEAEIKFLKSQINPHFLFNALNNIYSLTVLQSPQAPDNLLKLSDMLRYMLYDCKADTVPLHKEIDYLKHFIDLQKLKDSGGLKVKMELDESRPDIMIAPMLFIPFVENAFKHSKIEDLDKGWIEITLKTTPEKIIFEVKNSLPVTHAAKDDVGGIGLSNVGRQLELLYPNAHELRIERLEDRFQVYLQIKAGFI